MCSDFGFGIFWDVFFEDLDVDESFRTYVKCALLACVVVGLALAVLAYVRGHSFYG